MPRRIPWTIIVPVVFILILIIMGIVKNNPLREKTTREVAMSCTTDMATQFHIHAKLRIVISGVEQTIPANVGIDAGCMKPLHTHDASGTIHIESPVKRDFTLGDFFAIWGKPFSRDIILDAKIDLAHHIRMTVNGKDSDEYENLVARDDDEIVISYETLSK